MATFNNLYHATEVLKHILETQIVPPPTSVLVGPPPDSAVTTEELRISLLWVNEQPTHRNDGLLRNPDGTQTPPPASLSLFVLITGYGEDMAKNATGAHRVLGEVLRVFHAAPEIQMPIVALPTNSGKGKMGVSLVPLTPDLMEKLFSPLQIKHRPFLLYEVSPVQLVSLLPDKPVAPVVAPGKVMLSGPTTATPPIITRLTPRTLAEGGYLRVDGQFSNPITTVWIGSRRFDTGSFDVIDAGRAVGLALPTGGLDPVLPGVTRVSVVSGQLASEPAELRVVPAGSWSIDAPNVLSVAKGASLTLAGQGLSNAAFVYVWPDAGIFAPTDVRKVGGLVKTPTSVQFTVPNVPVGQYRIAVEIDLGPGVPIQFTPFVTMEITA
ncbi:MAG: Pvc16 family protein [Polyangiaceae bacterium]